MRRGICLVCYVLVKMSNFLKFHVQITKLKIASNPFAKGFRESTRSRDHHNSFSHLPSPFYTQHAASMQFHPHHPGPHPHTAPAQFLHPRQLLEANQQVYSIDGTVYSLHTEVRTKMYCTVSRSIERHCQFSKM